MRRWWASLLLAALGCHADPERQSPEPVAPSTEPKTQTELDCEAMCNAAIDLGCEDDSCALRCVNSVESAGMCREVTADYVACLGREGLETCYDVPLACDAAYIDWKGCSGGLEGGCGPVRCEAPEDAACQCEATCGERVFEETCFESDQGYECHCAIDGEVAVVCEASTIACAFFIGCCSVELQAMSM